MRPAWNEIERVMPLNRSAVGHRATREEPSDLLERSQSLPDQPTRLSVDGLVGCEPGSDVGVFEV
jgi:hypothetical protein